MDLENWRLLRTAAGERALTAAVHGYGTEDEFALGTRLRREYPPELVATALTQARLRARAEAKFDAGDAARMFFTVDGYEQATRAGVAAHRARRIARFAKAASPDARLLDLCCGIGGDLVELARAGCDVTGVEADPLTAEIARANVAALRLHRQARVLDADATTTDRSGYAAVTCDPARRDPRGRVFDPDAYRPSWSFLEELLAGTACVKVAPGLAHDRVPDGVEAEWVSERGQVKEAALWSGELARPSGDANSRTRRRATLLPAEVTLTDADDPGYADVRAPGRYLYEPDGAVIRAGLVTAVSAAVDGWLLDASIAYVGSDRLIHTPFARAYEVTEVLPYDLKVLRSYVRDHGLGILTIKKRGVDVVPEKLRPALRPRGDAEATLIVTRVSGRATVLVAQPSHPADDPSRPPSDQAHS